jgi:protein involved in polysaccharide export with SLBB domain
MFTMNPRRVAFFVWLACASWAGAQMSQAINGGPSGINQTYGAGPSSPPQMFQAPPKPAGQTSTGNVTGNETGNGTNNSPAGPLTPAPASPTGTSAPALTGNVPAAPAPAVPAPATSPYAGGDLTNFPMPETMEQIDNQRTLTGGDQFVYKVLEDHDKPVLLFVDEKGEIAPNIPYLPELHLKVVGRTLYEVAKKLKEELEDPQSGYYKHATVLLAFYKGNGSRGQVYVFGEVPKPGPVDVPSDSVLTLYQAILAAGGFKDTADKEHVQLTRQNLDDASKVTQQEVNFQKFFDGEGPEPNVVVQPGDVIKVPSRSEHPQDDIIVDGEVRSPLVLPPPPPGGKPLYLSEVMIQAGWTDWSNHTVQLIRYKNGKKTVEDHDVDDVLVRGNKDKDVQLLPGDMIIVKRNWWSFG